MCKFIYIIIYIFYMCMYHIYIYTSTMGRTTTCSWSTSSRGIPSWTWPMCSGYYPRKGPKTSSYPQWFNRNTCSTHSGSSTHSGWGNPRDLRATSGDHWKGNGGKWGGNRRSTQKNTTGTGTPNPVYQIHSTFPCSLIGITWFIKVR